MQNAKEIKDTIFAQFDFERVAYVMKVLDWQWAFLGRPPTVEELKQEVARLLDQVLSDQNARSVSVGGLKVKRDSYGVHVEFILSDAEYVPSFP